MAKRTTLKTLADTAALARRVAKTLRGGEVLALTGPLGSGKTTFVQYLARELGARERVKSPTFIVLQTFRIKLRANGVGPNADTLCHVDAYRLRGAAGELDALGLHDYLGRPDVVTVIEWAEKIKRVVPPDALWISFAYTGRQRTLTIEAKP